MQVCTNFWAKVMALGVATFLCAAGVGADNPEAWAGGKGKKGGMKGRKGGGKGGSKTQPESPRKVASKALLKKSEAIQDCGVTYGIDKGATKVLIETRVTIDSSGSILQIDTTVAVDKCDTNPIKSCVDQVIRSIQFPAIPAPLTTIERSWPIGPGFS